ncbi:MAG: DHH family phosphoesterase, partial [Clostridia bacterium]|nr:DHH family phosphoesterase [Clostridia bacterium]
MSVKKWIVGAPDREKAKLLAEEYDIDPFAALIAVGRGIDNDGELELLMSDEPILCDPLELADIRIAADYINSAITNNTKIAIFGDYDCDGVVATSLLYDYLKSRGAEVVAYIPDRIDEGYGMNCAAVDKLASQGVGLIVTVDNGISCANEIEYAESLGIKTVVTDHHLPPEELPNAVAVVDPHRKDCPSTFKDICGAEVAFKLVCVLDDKEPEEMLPRYADILAVSTIGDVMPLTNENRSIVKAGIRKIKSA